MSENKIMEAIDELIEDMRELIGERDGIQSGQYFEGWLRDLMFLGDMAGNILREITDPESIPDYGGLLDPPIQTDKRDYLDRE